MKKADIKILIDFGNELKFQRALEASHHNELSERLNALQRLVKVKPPEVVCPSCHRGGFIKA